MIPYLIHYTAENGKRAYVAAHLIQEIFDTSPGATLGLDGDHVIDTLDPAAELAKRINDAAFVMQFGNTQGTYTCIHSILNG